MKVNEKERKKLKIFMMAIFLRYSSFFGHFFIRDILINCVHIKKKSCNVLLEVLILCYNKVLGFNWEKKIMNSRIFKKTNHISGQFCFAISRLISWASVNMGWTANLAIPSSCYFPLYHCAKVDGLHVTRVLNVPRDRAMHLR